MTTSYGLLSGAEVKAFQEQASLDADGKLSLPIRDKGGQVYNVLAFGAKGDGATDDTPTIQAAIAAASNARSSTQPANGVVVLSEQAVFLPKGHYKISDALSCGGGVRIISDGAIIEQTDSTKKIFSFGDAYENVIEGIKFIGGTNQIYFANANTDTTLLKVRRCEFHFSGEFALNTLGTVGDSHMSANLTIEGCKFVKCKQILNNLCDFALIKDCWVYVDKDFFTEDTAAFVTGANTTTTLHFDNMFGVPTMGTGASRLASVRWVDLNAGAFISENSRYGAEDSGMPVVYNFAGYGTVTPFATGGYISIRKSPILTTGPSGGADTAVVNLRTEVPQFIEVTGNRYFADSTVIANSGGLDLDAYFDGISTPEGKFRFVVEPNSDWGIAGVPAQLRPFVQGVPSNLVASAVPTSGRWPLGRLLLNSAPGISGALGFVPRIAGEPGTWGYAGRVSPFPIGPQGATVLTTSTAEVTYTLPSDITTFAAFVTISGNPNSGGSGAYRTTAVYLLTMTTGFDGATQADYLDFSALFNPATPNVDLPTLDTVEFDGSGSANRAHVAGGNFTLNLLWSGGFSNDLATAFVSLDILHAA